MKSRSCKEVQQLIDQLRERLNDVVENNKIFDNDFYLHRWLTYHNLNVETAEAKIRRAIEWRQAVNLDELVEGDWAYFAPGLEKEVIITFEGVTKAGQPVSTTNGHSVDARAIIQKYGKDALVRYFFQFSGKLEKSLLDHYGDGSILEENFISDQKSNSQSTSEGESNVSLRPKYNPSWDTANVVHIVSYKNFSMKSVMCVEAIQAYIEGAKAGLTYFPLMVKPLYLVNLNKFSSLVFKLLKPIIVSHSFQVEAYDTDNPKWYNLLFDLMDADQIQPYFGGTREIHKGD